MLTKRRQTLRHSATALLVALGLALGALCVASLSGCTAAQLQQVETALPTAIAGQSVVVRAAGGPIDIEAQQRLVVRGKNTKERRQLVTDYRAARRQRLAVTHTTVEAIAKASAQLSTDLVALEADLARNDQTIDEQITGMAVEGEAVTPPAPPPSSTSTPASAPSAIPSTPAPAPPSSTPPAPPTT